MKKINFYSAVFLISMLTSSCEQISTNDPPIPMEGDLVIGISESYGYNSQPAPPSLFLQMTTRKTYPCLNYTIQRDVKINPGYIDVSITGVTVPNICLTAIGPASSRDILDITPGSYNLTIYSNGLTSNYYVVITNTSVSFDKDSTGNTHVRDKIVWRYPENSFVYLCGTLTQDSAIYKDFIDTLRSKIDITEFKFPSGGKIPYPTSSGGYYYNAPAKYFIYKSETDFDKIGDILKNYKEKYLKDKRGYGISIVSWKNKYFYSWLL